MDYEELINYAGADGMTFKNSIHHDEKNIQS